MRFKQFIAEQAFNLDKFFKDCAPFLEEIKGISDKHLAKHGTKTAPNRWGITEFQVRHEPRNSPPALHQGVNAFFKEKFGWAARSHSMFVSGDYEQASTYGPVCLVFPIGKFQTLWSPEVYDLYHEYSNAKDTLRRGGTSDEWDSLVDKATVNTITYVEHANWHFNTELKQGLKAGNEIMLFAPTYYQIRMWSDTHDAVLAALKERGITT